MELEDICSNSKFAPSFFLLCNVALELIEHLRAMGETNALLQRNIVSSTGRPLALNCLLVLQLRAGLVKKCSSFVLLLLLTKQCQMLKRETALATAAIYESMFASEDGTIPATFQVKPY